MITKDGKIDMEDFFIERLKYFMEERQLSRYKLGKLADVTQASLSTLMSKRCSPSMHTIDKIIDGLDMTPAQFFKDEIPNDATILTSEERHMLDLWRKMKHTDKMMVYAFAQGMVAKNKSEK